MTAGGHFAGVVVRVCQPEGVVADPKAAKHRKAKQQIEILRHKTFHRYTSECTICIAIPNACSHGYALQHDESRVARSL